VEPLFQWKSNKYYIFSVCFCSLRYPACNADAPYCHVTCVAVSYFSLLSHERHFFSKKVNEYKMCVLIFSTTYIKNISLFQKKCARYDKKMCAGLHVKYPLLLSDFNET
jgi:hypothetical protein